ncbi:alpha/beta hydrolase [Pseudenhygromyxa sp. WMMC2535]|uniref:esterase/lipase family protein n=1 Tax=Pseudenhygromyxa sp. WMMC2535 TaxID=2712867 RepID=UPI001557EDCA|nr:alpha/beta hydrolase [Pseudenhygromyxa sp. WMMC2535]NVB42390.1 alpha/beta hydrolase [Pseudenhygromyxa sp. WMMC2535]
MTRACLLLPLLVAACDDSTVASETSTLRSSDVDDAFDPNESPEDSFTVVGALTPEAWSWGELELLEGHQMFRTEAYNYRTEKLRASDTFQSSDYPLGTYFGDLNQAIVDTFNLAYGSSCVDGSSDCAEPGPMRPEARYVVLHKGPQTAEGSCDASAHAPVLLVHGALQDANVFLFPNGNDGSGGTFAGGEPVEGLVQSLEAEGRCVYAVTFGNFHGDNYNQAIHVANALGRVRQIHGDQQVDVIAWSKGVLAVDTYLSNAADWEGFGADYFDSVAAAQAAEVPLYRDDVRAYIALSGPHGGIDLNFRHPIHTLTIASTSSNAPVGRGPMPWTFFSALQCVTWGPDSPWYDNPYAASVCEGRGGTWPEYFERIYVSNLDGLDSEGKPVATSSLRDLNVDNGVSNSAFDFDEYNISLFGSIDEGGNHVSPYQGQLQAARDLRDTYPIPDRTSYAWSSVDPDEDRYFPWLDTKLTYNPYNIFFAAGYLDDDDHTKCRNAAFEDHSGECAGYHAYTLGDYKEGSDGLGYARYRLLEGLGIEAAEAMGGHFIRRLEENGLDSRLPALFVLYGSGPGAEGTEFETDGRSCPTCDGHSDGVLFESSVAAIDQLTQGWTAAEIADKATQESLPLGHLEMGIDASALARIESYLDDIDAQ